MIKHKLNIFISVLNVGCQTPINSLKKIGQEIFVRYILHFFKFYKKNPTKKTPKQSNYVDRNQY